MSVIFDKLAFARRLEGEGAFSRPQAEALTEAFDEAMHETVATKADLGEFRAGVKVDLGELRAEFGELRAEFAEFRFATKAEFAEVRHEIASSRSEMKIWMGSVGAGLFAALFTALGGLMTVFKFLVH